MPKLFSKIFSKMKCENIFSINISNRLAPSGSNLGQGGGEGLWLWFFYFFKRQFSYLFCIYLAPSGSDPNQGSGRGIVLNGNAK